jgi:hypothetical protein
MTSLHYSSSLKALLFAFFIAYNPSSINAQPLKKVLASNDLKVISLNTDRVMDIEGSIKVTLMATSMKRNYTLVFMILQSTIRVRNADSTKEASNYLKIKPKSNIANRIALALQTGLPSMSAHEAHNSKLLINILTAERNVRRNEWRLTLSEIHSEEKNSRRSGDW